MTKEDNNIPKLRFPEFNQDWNPRTISDSIEILKSGLSRELSTIDIGLPVIRANNLQNYNLVLDDIKYWFKEDPKGAKTENYYLKKNDILINFINSESKMGTSCIIKNNFKRDTIYTTNILRYVTKEAYDSYFHYIYTQTYNYKKWIKIITKPAVNQASFTTVDFKKIPYYIPEFEEQRKIGNFFSKLDRQIELEEQKLEKLEEQKKGYMQQIFSQQLRFKDDKENNYPEWEEKLISDIGKVVTGNTPSKKENEYWNSNQYVWVTPTDISNKKNISTSAYHLSQKGFEKARQLPKNTLLITCIASIGKNAILRIEGACNQQINAVIPNDNYDVDYLYYAFEEVSKLMKSIAGKTATQIVNKGIFEKLLLNVPILAEQKKISDFLSKIDILIDMQGRKIEALKKRKQGFLQKMFV